MKISEQIQCVDFPCADMKTGGYRIPDIDVDPETIRMLMISEAPSAIPEENFYSSGNKTYFQPTFQLFRDAGADVSNIRDILELGIYITTAVKCPKKEYGISTATIKACSVLLEKELTFFHRLKTIMLNGDVAIKALNSIAKAKEGEKAIPAGSTYKIRKNRYDYRGVRLLPSYILTGRNLLIEKSKRRMITEDLDAALNNL